MRTPVNPLAIWAGLLVLYVVWGTTYLGIRVAIETIPPFVMVAIRFSIAGLLLIGIVAIRERGAIRRPTRRELRDSLLVGTGLVVVGNGLVGWGEQTVATGIAALMVALMPAWAAALGRILFGDRLPVLAVIGIITGLVGIGLLSWPVDGQLALEPFGLLALLCAPIGWSLGSLYSARKATLPHQPLLATAYQMIGGAMVGLVVATLDGELARFVPAAVSDRSIVAMTYLTIVGSLLGYTTYGWLIRVAPLSRVTTYAYVNPIVAVGLGAVALGEPITGRTLIASVVIIAAVALIVTARSRGVTIRHAPDAPAAVATAAPGAADQSRPPEPAAAPVTPASGTRPATVAGEGARNTA
jgi:drug/metabolite transporter (DMT)-like permease